MIHQTPHISDEVFRHLQSDNYRDRPILKNYTGFDNCFVYLHPFLQLNNNCNSQHTFETIDLSSKADIEENCNSVKWNKILQLTGIQSIQSLDRALAYLHRAYRYGERAECKKLQTLLEERNDLMLPQVDDLPEIIENKLFKKLYNSGYESLFVYSDITNKNKLISIKDLLTNSYRLPSHVRIETPDSKILIAQDFDQRFTYFFSNIEILNDLIYSLDLEGFFCDDKTPESWSYYDIPKRDRIDY